MVGIIPARAGFTASPSRSPRPRRDHPRSRGVYAPWARIPLRHVGSSPLARGLQHWQQVVVGQARIIPARAGFTRGDRGQVSVLGDHPRSRGVYVVFEGHFTADRGSSPLARGLLKVGHQLRVLLRIIPARAGFTTEVTLCNVPWEDHPRSRGVYVLEQPPAPWPGGSSPLARGLLTYNEASLNEYGIIPARAGFTLRTPSPNRRARDHPRSRGVYPCQSSSRHSSDGSSPLARGLRKIH